MLNYMNCYFLSNSVINIYKSKAYSSKFFECNAFNRVVSVLPVLLTKRFIIFYLIKTYLIG